MKIILSPSKTQDFTKKINAPMTKPLFEEEAIKLNNRLKRLSKKAIQEMMHLDGDLLINTLNNIKAFQSSEPNHVIVTYTGLVFKYFDVAVYGEAEMSYLNTHLNILSAQYGLLRPYDGIRPYRLDMKMKPNKKDLYDYWHKSLASYFNQDEVIIDLASTEFSKMVQGNKVTVGFRDYKDGQYKNLATYAKMARGMLLHQMVLNKTDSIESLKAITFDAYTYNETLSSDQLIIFSRETP